MATIGPNATLIAAFTFGNLFNAAFGALVPNVRGHGSTVFRDGKRLALVIFLLSAALWAQIEFATELIDPTATQACQIGIIFTTAFDQLARIAIEQFSLWVIFDGVRVSTARTAAHILLFARLALGVVFVALSRPAFDTTCVAISSNFPVASAVVAADVLFILALAVAAFVNRNVVVISEGEKQNGRPRSMALLVFGLVLWLATSAIMLLGLASTSFFLRAVIPATGLSILLVILTSVSPKFMGPGPSDREQRLPEAPSPRPIMRARSYSTSASDNYYPPNRYEDLKTEQLNSMTAFIQPREVPVPGRPSSVQPAMLMGSREFDAEDFMQEQMAKAPLQPVSRNVPKRSLFNNANKAPAGAITVGKLAISYPMLQEGGTNPLDKVATMDLATAAQLEKEKRALAAPRGLAAMQTMAAASQGSSGIPPGFSAPPTRAYRIVSPQNSLTRVPTVVRMEAILQQQNDDASASTTGAWLSRASDELRRRSPKQSPTNSFSTSSTSFPPKTPVQQRATAGLPKTPRSRSLRRRAEDPASLRQETVMFVNNIVYDNPEFVASVMDTAKDRGMQAKMPAPLNVANSMTDSDASYYSKHPSSAVSVVNRPRPIPRKQRGEDGSFYPHRRTRSAGSLLNRKSLLQYDPGSPTELPPLPLLPQSAKGYRPLPNDTKSMTFDEKVILLVSQNNNPSERQYKRRSSLPIMERSFIDDSPTLANSEDRATKLGGSKRSTATAQMRSIFGEQDQNSQRGVSLNTYRELMDETDDGVNSPEGPGNKGMVYNVKRASSPLLPIFAEPKSASTTMSSDDERLTNVYSPLPIQQIGLPIQQTRAIKVVNMNRPSDNRAASTVTNSEEMTIMLDSSIVRDAQINQSDYLMPPRDDGRSWHRRIGDETLSFSTPSDKRGSRRGPPPQPLKLSERPTPAKQVAMLKAVEPSPLPSPGEALKKIEAQLKKYEVVDQATVQSPGRQALLNELEAEMGMQETRWRGMQSEYSRDSMSTFAMTPTLESRRTSLANGPPVSQQNLSRNSSTRSNMGLNWRDTRRSRLMSILSQRSSVNSMDGVPPGSRATIWQKRLAQAEHEFMQSTQGPNHRQSVNFLHLSSQIDSPPPFETSYEPELGTARSDIFPVLLESQTEKDSAPKGLWTATQAPEALDGLMWVRPTKPYHVSVIEPTLPGLSVRPAQRKVTSSLPIHSSQLWQKPTSNERNDFALWGSPVPKSVETKLVETPMPQSGAASSRKPSIEASRTAPSSRPLTQRPPRRSKRFTGLADIIEDPQPLPNKRDTLGIFQFPWGEKSDTPFAPQRTRAIPMAGTMSSGASSVLKTLNARSQQVQESQNSSFFDDGDEDEEDGILDDSSSMGSESGDEFDDTTLFKIASLLQADNVPSTNSFFGAPRDSMGSDLFYDYYEESNEEQENPDRQTINVDIEEGDDELQEMPVSRTRPSMLWETTAEMQRGDSGKGLPQAENWQAYNETTETIRAKPRLSTQPATIASDSLWANKQLSLVTSDSTIWSVNKQSETSYFESSPSSPSASEHSELATPDDIFSEAHAGQSSLWKFEEKPQQGDHNVGLSQPQDWKSHEVDKSAIRAKLRQSEVTSIESFNLWEAEARAQPLSPSKMWKDRSQPKKEDTPSSAKVSTIVQSQTSLLLWSVPPVTKESRTTGLFDLDSDRTEFRTTTAAPAALSLSRKPRSAAVASWASITSTDLWMAVVAPQTRTNWLDLKSATKRELLWSAPLGLKLSTPTGMFALQSGRTEFRTTTEAPAALLMTRKPRSSAVVSLASIASTSLWMVVSAPQTTTDWLRLKSNSQKKLLWSACSISSRSAVTGLFTAQSGRTEFRTTAQPPAALEISRKPRTIEWTSLDSLSSSSLWSARKGAEAERNWLATKDRSERNMTTTTRNTGAKQLLWSATEVHPEVASGLFSLHTGRTEFRSTDMVPAATGINRKSRVAERRPLEALSSTALWTAQAMSDPVPVWILGVLSKVREVSPQVSLSVEDAVEDVIQAVVAQEEPVRKQAHSTSLQRPATVSIQQWQEALNEAISASCPAQLPTARKAPIEASAVDWNTALIEAMAASYPVQRSAVPRKAPIEASGADWNAALAQAVAKSYRPAFDVSRRHPVFAGTSLTSNASVLHPAATGYTHNVAVMHPVFFGSGAGVMAHPAMTLASKIARTVAAQPSKMTGTDLAPISAVSKSTAAIMEPQPALEPRPIIPRAVVPPPPAAAAAAAAAGEAPPRPLFSASQNTQRGRKGARISAMASRFEGSTSQSRSVSRDSFAPISSFSRNTMAPRTQSPAPQMDKGEDTQQGEVEEVSELDAAFYAQIEALEKKREQAMAPQGQEDEEEEDGDQEDQGADAAFYAQIEALEMKRGAVEQMAAESFAARPAGASGEDE